jgi:uncharacterized membrane protein
MFKWIPWMGFLILLSACSAKHSPGDISSLGDIEDVRFTHIVQFIFEPRCKKCHFTNQSTSGIDLFNYDQLLNEFVIPFNSAESILYEAVATDYMPENGPPLTAQQKALIQVWIDSGANP